MNYRRLYQYNEQCSICNGIIVWKRCRPVSNDRNRSLCTEHVRPVMANSTSGGWGVLSAFGRFNQLGGGGGGGEVGAVRFRPIQPVRGGWGVLSTFGRFNQWERGGGGGGGG